MFNKEMKEKFLETIEDQDKQNELKELFENCTEFEEKTGKDLAKFSNEEVFELFKFLQPLYPKSKILVSVKFSESLDDYWKFCIRN